MQIVYVILVGFIAFLLIIGIRVFSSTGLRRTKKVVPSFNLNVVFTILLIVFIGAAIYLGFNKIADMYSSSKSSQKSEIPLASAPQVLKVPANGDSVRINPNGKKVIFRGGDDFSTHCVYSDGRPEGIVGDPTHPCGDGPMLYVYAHNNTGREISLVYTLHK